MPCYHFTYHAYCSWLPDKPRGYVHREKGHLPQDIQLGDHYREIANHPEMIFEPHIAKELIAAAKKICGIKSYRLHRVEVVESHLHTVVSWRSLLDWKCVRNTLKRCLGAELSIRLNRKGPWFCRGGSSVKVKDQEHFDYLVNVYLPRHGGIFWDERFSRD